MGGAGRRWASPVPAGLICSAQPVALQLEHILCQRRDDLNTTPGSVAWKCSFQKCPATVRNVVRLILKLLSDECIISVVDVQPLLTNFEKTLSRINQTDTLLNFIEGKHLRVPEDAQCIANILATFLPTGFILTHFGNSRKPETFQPDVLPCHHCFDNCFPIRLSLFIDGAGILGGVIDTHGTEVTQRHVDTPQLGPYVSHGAWNVQLANASAACHTCITPVATVCVPGTCCTGSWVVVVPLAFGGLEESEGDNKMLEEKAYYEAGVWRG